MGYLYLALLLILAVAVFTFKFQYFDTGDRGASQFQFVAALVGAAVAGRVMV